MKRSSRALAAAAAGAFVLWAAAHDSGAHDRITTKVSWARDIAPMVEARCASCHRPDGRAPMSLLTYDDARPWAKAIKEEVLARRMPKWHAARGYGDFLNDRSLSPFEIALIVAWVDGGAPKDLPAKTPALPAAAPAPPSAPKGAREITLPCNNRPLPPGRLVAVRPRLQRGASAGISVQLPGGRQEIVAWIRDFDPEFEDTYWLRRPVALAAGSRLLVDAQGPCRIAVTVM
jgi:mono/diheme cytochrome c family protein